MAEQPVLIDGQWRRSAGQEYFPSHNPATGETLEGRFPVSPASEVEQAIEVASGVAAQRDQLRPEMMAAFLECYAEQIESRAEELAATAHAETALPITPRLRDGELPRTTGQLRQAAAAARDGSWVRATIDSANNIRSQYEPIGPVVVFGPNNFPFAFNSISGGDFAAAIAAGNPVIAKGHPSHPETTRLFAEAVVDALAAADAPRGLVQLLYDMSPGDGPKLVADRRIGASAFTGSRRGGLALKEAADRAGAPIYLEMSSINPVLILPGALAERAESIAEELTKSCLMGTGQFCTNPGLVILHAGPEAETFVEDLAGRFAAAPVGVMLSHQVEAGFLDGVNTLREAGAELLLGGEAGDGASAQVSNTLLRATAGQFLGDPRTFQTECFGNGTLILVADGPGEVEQVLSLLEGNLTGTIYSDSGGGDEAAYGRLAPRLTKRVGRLLNDKMPTGVAVSPAMVHGGPFPATGHPGFTSVGIPAAMERFARRVCYDNVRPSRLPAALADGNPEGRWRSIDGQWTRTM